MVAHFDYWWNKGNPTNSRGVVLIPKIKCTNSAMNATNTTEGAYNNSIANSTICPAIATALSTVLGSYLLTFKALRSTAMNANISSKAGLNWSGASSNWGLGTFQCILPNEIQIYGCQLLSSSFMDAGTETEKLAVFNFINQNEYIAMDFWLRDVASSTKFARAGVYGHADGYDASFKDFAIRPLIYIG